MGGDSIAYLFTDGMMNQKGRLDISGEERRPTKVKLSKTQEGRVLRHVFTDPPSKVTGTFPL